MIYKTMKIVKIINDVVIMDHNGFTYMAAIDCFESNSYTIGSYINKAGLPALVVRTSIPGALIYNTFREKGIIT